MYFPHDMDATVAYVAPNAYGVEDIRHGKFLKKVAKASDRKAILNFQKELLKRKSRLMPLFNEYSNSKNYTYRLSNEEIFDYCVLEFSFAFWQWGARVSSIPTKKDSDQKLFYYLIGIASPSYFAIEDIEPTFPFFYQAARELGYYAYDTKPLRKYLSIESAENYLHKIFLSEDMKVEYDPSTSERLTKFTQTTSNKIALVYGEYDPWTAAEIDFGNNPNIVKILIPKASHAGRIISLSKDKYDEYVSLIETWLK